MWKFLRGGATVIPGATFIPEYRVLFPPQEKTCFHYRVPRWWIQAFPVRKKYTGYRDGFAVQLLRPVLSLFRSQRKNLIFFWKDYSVCTEKLHNTCFTKKINDPEKVKKTSKKIECEYMKDGTRYLFSDMYGNGNGYQKESFGRVYCRFRNKFT